VCPSLVRIPAAAAATSSRETKATRFSPRPVSAAGEGHLRLLRDRLGIVLMRRIVQRGAVSERPARGIEPRGGVPVPPRKITRGTPLDGRGPVTRAPSRKSAWILRGAVFRRAPMADLRQRGDGIDPVLVVECRRAEALALRGAGAADIHHEPS
jgi:hypothetical protein